MRRLPAALRSAPGGAFERDEVGGGDLVAGRAERARDVLRGFSPHQPMDGLRATHGSRSARVAEASWGGWLSLSVGALGGRAMACTHR